MLLLLVKKHYSIVLIICSPDIAHKVRHVLQTTTSFSHSQNLNIPVAFIFSNYDILLTSSLLHYNHSY